MILVTADDIDVSTKPAEKYQHKRRAANQKIQLHGGFLGSSVVM